MFMIKMKCCQNDCKKHEKQISNNINKWSILICMMLYYFLLSIIFINKTLQWWWVSKKRINRYMDIWQQELKENRRGDEMRVDEKKEVGRRVI